MPEPIDPATWDQPGMRVALAHRDIAAVYRLLTGAGVSQRRIAELTGMGASEVSEVLAGRQVQSVVVLERIADGLGVPRGWLGLAHDERTRHAYAGDRKTSSPEEMDEDMKRRAFLAAASMALWGRPVLGDLLELPARPDAPTPLPARLGAADVDAIRALTERTRELVRFYGGQADTASAIANRSLRLLDADAAESVKRDLGSALAELHSVAGWAGFDAHLDDTARYHFGRAIELASDAGDAHGHAYAMWLASSLPGERGHPDDALKLLQLGQTALAPATADPFMAGWLRAESAFELSRMSRADKARPEMAAALDGWEAPDDDEAADMDATVAEMELNLGDLDAAESAAASAVQRWEGNPDRRRSALGRITLAQLHVQTGEQDGLLLAEQAIRGVAELRSQRARDRLAPLADALAARPGSESRELAAHARRVAAAV